MTIARPRLERAACRGLDHLFLKPRPRKSDRAQIREICRTCQDRPPCLAYALEHEEHGYWAGHTPEQLRALRARYGITIDRLSNELWAHDIDAYTGVETSHADATAADG